MEVLESGLLAHMETVLCSLRKAAVIPVEPTDCAKREMEYRITTSIYITGNWQGVVSAECSYAMAVDIAAAMYQMDPADLSEDEVRDALGEVANLLAGQFKTELPEGCALSLPMVTKGLDFLVNVPGARLTQRAVARQDGGCMTMSVFERL